MIGLLAAGMVRVEARTRMWCCGEQPLTHFLSHTLQIQQLTTDRIRAARFLEPLP
jgi:hypothetical protein